MTGFKPDWAHVLAPAASLPLEADSVVLIVDLDLGSKSVTNGAEEVIHELANHVELAGVPVYYRDSAGQWDELAHEDGHFAGFAPAAKRLRVQLARLWARLEHTASNHTR